MAGYGDDTGFASWLTDNGLTLPAGAKAPSVLRNIGSEYIDATYGARFVGQLADPAQERAWPRIKAIASGQAVGSSAIPAAVVRASYRAAYQEAVSPGSLSVVGSQAGAVKRKKVGQLEVEYQDALDPAGGVISITPLISIVDGMLAPYLIDISTPGFGIWSIGGSRECL